MTISNGILEEIWSCVLEKKRISPTLCDDMETVCKVTEILHKCSENKTMVPIENSSLPEELRTSMKSLVTKYMQQDKDDFKWSLDVVVGNKHVQKSLQVLIIIDIKGQKYEFDIEQFAKLRQGLAAAVVNVQKYG